MSTGANVLRYTALATGVLIGFSHQRSLNAAARAANNDHSAYAHRRDLIDRAKREFERTSPNAAAASGGNVISDPMDPKFDLEAWIKDAAGEGAGAKA